MIEPSRKLVVVYGACRSGTHLLMSAFNHWFATSLKWSYTFKIGMKNSKTMRDLYG